MKKLCYYCGEPATSVEHVPPRMFFPATKDLGAKYGDFRVQQRTVPACARHNNAYNLDDEYAACALACHMTNNGVASDHFLTKILRVFKNNPKLIQTVFRQLRPVRYDNRETGLFQIDIHRIERVLDKIAHAIYWCVVGSPMPASESLIFISSNLLLQDGALSPAAPTDARFESLRERFVFPCGDPRVFQAEYALRKRARGPELFRFTFYEGIRFLGGVRAESPPASPPDTISVAVRADHPKRVG